MFFINIFISFSSFLCNAAKTYKIYHIVRFYGFFCTGVCEIHTLNMKTKYALTLVSLCSLLMKSANKTVFYTFFTSILSSRPNFYSKIVHNLLQPWAYFNEPGLGISNESGDLTRCQSREALTLHFLGSSRVHFYIFAAGRIVFHCFFARISFRLRCDSWRSGSGCPDFSK